MTRESLPSLAVLAGGMGTRLYPMTQAVPKCMIEVAGEPFVAHQLRLFARQGIHNVVLCVGFLEQQIREFVGDGAQFGLSVSYSSDGEAPRGTGGALRNALPELGAEFLVVYGDSYLDVALTPIVEAFHRSGCSALLTVLRNENEWDRSNTQLRGKKVLCHDKRHPTADMKHIDYGLSCLKADIFETLDPAASFDLSDLYADLAMRGQLAAYEVTKRFYEIGSHQGLLETGRYLLQKSRCAD